MCSITDRFYQIYYSMTSIVISDPRTLPRQSSLCFLRTLGHASLVNVFPLFKTGRRKRSQYSSIVIIVSSTWLIPPGPINDHLRPICIHYAGLDMGSTAYSVITLFFSSISPSPNFVNTTISVGSRFTRTHPKHMSLPCLSR